MPSTNAVNQVDAGLEEIVVQGTKALSTGSEELKAHRAVYLQKSQQNLELKGQLSNAVSVGGSWKFTGNTHSLYIGPTLSYAFKFYEVEIKAGPNNDEFQYAHLAYADSEGYSADQQKQNYHNDAYLTGFNCGGNTYQNITAGGSSLTVGNVVQNTNTGSGAAQATATVVGAGDQVTAGIVVCNDKGGNTIASGAKGYALTAGLSLSSSITAANGSDINYTSSGALTSASGEGFVVGRVFQAKGTNNYSVLSLNLKGGLRTSI